MLVIAGCSNSNNGGGKPDLSQGNNTDPDLSTPDPEDMRKPKADLSSTDDLSVVTPDMVILPVDFSGVDLIGVDLSTVTVPPDLGGADLRNPADMTTLPDLGGTVAWGQPCVVGTTCAQPSSELGFCSLVYGHPICLHSCNGQSAFTTCEGGAGLCYGTDSGDDNVCMPKCGDSTNTTCPGGSACAYVGSNTNNGFAVGICTPDCGAGGDACTAAGRVCDPIRRTCVTSVCTSCPTNSTCAAGVCVPNTPKPAYASCNPNTKLTSGCASNLCFSSDGVTTGVCGSFCDSSEGFDPAGGGVCGTGGVCWADNNRIIADGTSAGIIDSVGIGQFLAAGGRTSGACMKKCTTNTDCPTGATCSEWNGFRACLFSAPLADATLPATGTGLPGEVCRNPADCASGSCVGVVGYVDGICTKAAAASCPSNTVDQGSNICLLKCDPSMPLQCNGSQVCDGVFSGANKDCRIGLVCRTNDDCDTGSGYACQATSGECRLTANTGTGAVGTPCTAATNCAGNVCETAANGFPLGYCTSACTLLPDFSDTCPSGSLCLGIGAANFSVGSVGLCFDLCDPAATPSLFGGGCRANYKCTGLAQDPTHVGFCQPM